ncbi:MAG: dehydrogenase, partial [Verrucomicrobiota bacterium]
IQTLLLLPAIGLAETPPVHSPEEQWETFVLAEPGYRIELVASEPMIQDPVAMTFDGQGRLWVVEMRSYMRDVDGSSSKDPIGRISVLQDLDGDGLMDKGTVFLDDLVLPRSIAVFPDGVLVAENKPLWFVKDTDGDLVADEKTLVDEDYARDNIEHSANGLLYALDNWIYNAKEGHRYRRNGDEWIRESTEKRGQWGISQDDYGRLYYNYNHSQLHSDQVPPNTLTRNENHDPSTGLSVGVTNTNEVFPIRPNTATNRGYIPGALDENGSIKQFTSACAPFIYREALLPAFSGNAFVAGTAGNLVKRNTLSGSGVGVVGTPAYPDRDFIASTDERFRPCWISSGPDGALYIVDMYRGIVQDAPHMSPYLREHSIERKMEGPIHLGRIWRVVPDHHTQPEAPDFASMSAGELVDHLDHESGWWRDKAQQHLVTRNLTESIPLLERVVQSADSELARLHALWTLEGLRPENLDVIFAALDDDADAVQSAALRILEQLDASPDLITDQIERLSVGNPSTPLALQMVLTLGDLPIQKSRKHAQLSRLLLPRITDPLFRDAAISSLAGEEAEFLNATWEELAAVPMPSAGAAFL